MNIGQAKTIRKTDYEVLESDGVKGHKYPVHQVKHFNQGHVYLYYIGQTLERVYTGRDYVPLLVDGLYWIGKNVGNNSAAPLIKIKDDDGDEHEAQEAAPITGDSTDPHCPGQDLSRIVASDVLHIGWAATKKKNYAGYIAIAAAIVIVIVILKARGII